MAESARHLEVLIGGRGGDHVLIRVLGRVHPDAHDFWDANWLMTPVEVVAGDFLASIGASLRAEEIHEFRSGLTRVYESPQGEATLQSMEGWLSLRVSIDGPGDSLLRARLRISRDLATSCPSRSLA